MPERVNNKTSQGVSSSSEVKLRLTIIVRVHFQPLRNVISLYLMCGSRGGGGSGGLDPPLENYKNIGFLSNTGPDPLNHKATKPAFNVASSSARQ